MIIFFFKQKTAYEMRISDWSSDVCSSDLSRAALAKLIAISTRIAPSKGARGSEIPIGPLTIPIVASCPPTASQRSWISSVMLRRPAGARAGAVGRIAGRSEEHTSELQSLMRISYAVFCLKKKITERLHHTKIIHLE